MRGQKPRAPERTNRSDRLSHGNQPTTVRQQRKQQTNKTNFKTPNPDTSLSLSLYTINTMASSQSDEPAPEEREIDITTSIEPGSDVLWVRTGSEQEMDLPSSPSSSGYAGEGGGSTSATTGSLIEIEHDEEVEQEQMRIQNQIDEISISDSNTSWIPGKRHQDEVYTLIFSLYRSMPMHYYKYMYL